MLRRRWVLRRRKEKERRRILSKKRMEIEKLLMIPYLREASACMHGTTNLHQP